MNEIQVAIKNLELALRKNSSDTAVSFTIFINSEEVVSHWSNRSPEQLKDSGISMKNLAGNFIK